MNGDWVDELHNIEIPKLREYLSIFQIENKSLDAKEIREVTNDLANTGSGWLFNQDISWKVLIAVPVRNGGNSVPFFLSEP